jgi:phosphate transport system substrate-binding protein
MQEPGSEHVIALDGLMILVAAENPAVSISITDVAKMFAGQITDWSQIGLPPGQINLYAATEGSGTWDLFNELIMKPQGLKFSPDAKTVLSHDERSDAVARDPLAITFAGLSSQRNAKALNVESACGLITRPSRFTVKTEEYPLARRLYLYTSRAPRSQLARGLLQFALSPAAQPIVASVQFVDQSAETLAFREQGGRIAHALNAPQEDFNMDMMRRLIKELSTAKRLSLTFWFITGGATLDSRAQQDVLELQRLMLSPAYRGKSVVLLGFADSTGSFVNNLNLSLRRAQQVRSALLSGIGAKIPATSVGESGYSELSPVACNTTTEGRTLNRRVEVWVRG